MRYAASCSLLFAAGCSAPTPPDALDEPILSSFGRSTLSVEAQSGKHDFSIYVADSPSERRQGLMFVEDMPDDVGMLFVYPNAGTVSMWMKNTIMPLDILFVQSDGTIKNIARNTTPGSLKSIPADGKVCCALELKAGMSERLGINAGDRLIHATFQRP